MAALVTAGIVFAVSQLTEFGPTDRALIDPMWLFSIVAGVVGYLAGRSRRSAFIAGTLGIILTDVIHTVRALATGIPTTAALGGAGIFDTVVIAGIIAVLLAELVGETRERIQGGPGEHEGQTVLHNEEFLQMETQQTRTMVKERKVMIETEINADCFCSLGFLTWSGIMWAGVLAGQRPL